MLGLRRDLLAELTFGDNYINTVEKALGVKLYPAYALFLNLHAFRDKGEEAQKAGHQLCPTDDPDARILGYGTRADNIRCQKYHSVIEATKEMRLMKSKLFPGLQHDEVKIYSDWNGRHPHHCDFTIDSTGKIYKYTHICAGKNLRTPVNMTFNQFHRKVMDTNDPIA